MEEKERAKRAFFDELYALDEEDEEDEIEDIALTLMRKCSRKIDAESKVAVTPGVNEIPMRKEQSNAASLAKLARTVSAPVPVASTLLSGEIGRIKETPACPRPSLLPHASEGDERVVSNPLRARTGKRSASTDEMPKASGKRKRDKPLQLKPEAQQIFKGLKFLFIPNNDISPARRMRINKAQEYGATWIKEWKDEPTHIIVDRDIPYKDVLSFLRLEELPANVTMVNEIYPAECIMFRFMVDPKLSHYQLDGYKEAQKAKTDVPSSLPSSIESLPLKPEKRRLFEQRETPSRREPSSEGSSAPIGNAHAEPDIVSDSFVADEGASTSNLPNQRPKDILDEAIKEAKALEQLPLDSDDEDPSSASATPAASDTESEDMDRERNAKRPKTKQASEADRSWQQSFLCMHSHTGSTSNTNPNAHTISILEQMATYYTNLNDHWRSTAYRKAIAVLRKQPGKINTYAAAITLPSIGHRLALKIEEIAHTKGLRRLDHALRDSPHDAALNVFLNIYGVGFAQASKWVAQGHRSLDDLQRRASLTENQKVGIAHYDDFLQRIPRAEVEAHGAVVRDAAREIDPELEVIVMGSYRRGAADSGDVDLIFTKAGDATVGYLRTVVMDTLVPSLFARGFLKCTLATSAGKSKSSGTKWHGASCLPSSGKSRGAGAEGKETWRRIDFLLVPPDELGAATIYFTGNDVFNRSLRLLASKKGMRLNQRGLFKDVSRARGTAGRTQGTLVEERMSERRIFEVLGVPYRRPEERIC